MIRLLLTLLLAQSLAAQVPPGTEAAHQEIWRRFMDPHGVMLDFTDLDGSVPYPTPEECQQGKPNALGWWSPIENGAMFNGLYMDAAVSRWEQSQRPEDQAKARRVMLGLLKLNSVSGVPGFVARGFSTDGHSHYAMGSNDQTLPWLAGLWRYHQSPISSKEERSQITQHLTTTVLAIKAANWAMPAEPPFHKRGSFQGHHFEEAARMLFTLKMMARLTGDTTWQLDYETELQHSGGEPARSKLETCRAGMAYFYAPTHTWTSCTAVMALRLLWEMENDPALKQAFAQGLNHSAELAAKSLALAEKWDPKSKAVFTDVLGLLELDAM
jgi:hypothetical protein